MLISLDQFYARHNGKGMDYDGAPFGDPVQCVDLAKFYLNECFGVNPGAWGDAHAYFDGLGAAKLRALGFQIVANNHHDPNQVPPRGAIIIWARTLPGSGDGGHIAIGWNAKPGAGTFVSFDQNWGGKTARLITHNWSYVLGWIIPPSGGRGGGETVPAPAVVPTPQIQGDEMIADTTQAHQAYQLLRPNGDGNDAEIAGAAGKRTWAQFAKDAQPEITARNANLRDQAAHMAHMQDVINNTNTTVTSLQETINSSQISNAEKQAALDKALEQVAADNAEITTLHDQVSDLQKKLANPLENISSVVADAGKSSGLVVAFLKFFMQFKLKKS